MKIVQLISDNSITFILTLFLSIIAFHFTKRLAPTIGLVDRPNTRKVHKAAVPVIGGLTMGLITATVLLLSPVLGTLKIQFGSVLIGAYLLLVVGILDDRYNVKASIKLVFQIGLALLVISQGIFLTSLYGIFGITNIPDWVGQIITLTLIVGVVNAFNLIDGIDGLAGFFSLLGLIVLAGIAIKQGESFIACFFLIVATSVIVFLFHNLGKKKIFLGDGGSLFVGFLLVTSGLYLIGNHVNPTSLEAKNDVAHILGVFLVPVIDSIRVYTSRILAGYSPFRADKSHMHHLIISFNQSHKKASIIITGVAVISILIIVAGCFYFEITTILVFIILLLLTVSQILNAVHKLKEWKTRIQLLEYRN